MSFGPPDDAPSLDELADCFETVANWHAESWEPQGVGATFRLEVGSDLFRPRNDAGRRPPRRPTLSSSQIQ